MKMLRKRDWGFVLLVIVFALTCIRLGFWQLDRLAQRRAANEQIRARLDEPPVDISGTEIGPSLAYRRAIAAGKFDPQDQILLENQSLNGQSGFHLISPLLFQNADGAILVDRGWIPFESGMEANLEQYEVPGLIEVTGVLIPSVGQPAWGFLADPIPEAGEPPLQTWRFLTIELIQKQVEYPLASLILLQGERLDAGAAFPQPDATIELDEGPHLGYAIQWFAFATIAVAGGSLWVRRQLVTNKEGQAEG
jgi:surfeit locus 1 family protein